VAAVVVGVVVVQVVVEPGGATAVVVRVVVVPITAGRGRRRGGRGWRARRGADIRRRNDGGLGDRGGEGRCRLDQRRGGGAAGCDGQRRRPRGRCRQQPLDEA